MINYCYSLWYWTSPLSGQCCTSCGRSCCSPATDGLVWWKFPLVQRSFYTTQSAGLVTFLSGTSHGHKNHNWIHTQNVTIVKFISTLHSCGDNTAAAAINCGGKDQQWFLPPSYVWFSVMVSAGGTMGSPILFVDGIAPAELSPHLCPPKWIQGLCSQAPGHQQMAFHCHQTVH